MIANKDGYFFKGVIQAAYKTEYTSRMIFKIIIKIGFLSVNRS